MIQYISPSNETSVFKNIPISMRDSDFIKGLLRSAPYRIRYRGPRYDANAQTCLKKDAVSFAIYVR